MATMADKRDYYEVLGVARNASQQQIAEAYRKLAIKYHPDKNPGDQDAVRLFKETAEAFEVLHDPEKRARYDRYGHAGVGGAGAQFTDVEDIFQAFGDFFGGGVFGDLFGGRRGRRRARKGDDIRVDVTLDLIEAFRGCTKTVRFQRGARCTDCGGSGAAPGSSAQPCTYCGGRGHVVQSAGILRVQTTCPACRGAGNVIQDPCRTCRGNGFVSQTVQRTVQIPPGVDDGMRIRVPGEGQPSPENGPPGDCYCFISVRPHPLFRREGQHVICRVPIGYTQAALGATIEVPTLEGKEPFDIPPGTQPGTLLTLHGRGLPDPHGRGRRGDLVVEVYLEVPKTLSGQQERLLRELAELENANVTPHRKNFFERLKEYFVAGEGEAKSG
jgi:molecular chaperone DnaJ